VGRKRVLRRERGWTARGVVQTAMHGSGSRLSLWDVGKIGSEVASPVKDDKGDDYTDGDEDWLWGMDRIRIGKFF